MFTPEQYHKATSVSEKSRAIYILSFGGGIGKPNLLLDAKSKLEAKNKLNKRCFFVNWQVYNTTKHFLIGAVSTVEVHADVVCTDSVTARTLRRQTISQSNPNLYLTGDLNNYYIGDTVVFNHPEGKTLEGMIYSYLKNEKYLIKYNPDPGKSKIRYIYVNQNNVYQHKKSE
jgi:hypothetical protein